MYITENELKENIPFPKGSVVSVLGENETIFDCVGKDYKLVNTIQDDTRFVVVAQSEESALNTYRASTSSLPFCIAGNTPENALILDVLWNETKPFIAKFNTPLFMVKTGDNTKEKLLFFTRLVFALAEKITQEIIETGESRTTLDSNLFTYFLKGNTDMACNLAKSVMGRIDGLKQAESALLLLKIKEKNIFSRSDCLVLLAKNLSKVYNYFINSLPSTLFAPDNVERIEVLREFFGIQNPSVRRVMSEYEIRKKYYMISQNHKVLSQTWERANSLIEQYFTLIRPLVVDHGFCLEEHSEDMKFATFVAPDVLSGDTLLSFIKDCGIGDNFI